MRSVVQRVRSAEVRVDGAAVAAIGDGLLALVGVAGGDAAEDAAWLAARLVRLRVFADAQGRMNRSLLDTGGGLLVVSQFTLCADLHGHRPGFTPAAAPAVAQPLIEAVAASAAALLGRPVGQGRFGADMQVSLINDGPATFVLDSRVRG